MAAAAAQDWEHQEGARWVIEEEWPVFIKLMNVWSLSATPR